MNIKFIEPSEIENESMRRIEEELDSLGIELKEPESTVIKRVIHATADFDFARNLLFSEGAIDSFNNIIKDRGNIICDTNMTLSGINKAALKSLDLSASCYMSSPDVIKSAKERNITRAVCAVEKAIRENENIIYAVGNAPTALFKIVDEIEKGFRPRLIIGVPVGFVNVIEAKELMIKSGDKYNIPYIVSLGRKGGSTVSCAIINALLYRACKERASLI